MAGQLFGDSFCSNCPVPDYFKRLDLAENATDKTIKKQCRNFKKKLHPDKNNTEAAKEQWGLVDEACRILNRRNTNSTLDEESMSYGTTEDTYEAYVAKRNLCKTCTRDSASWYWSSNRFAEEMEPSMREESSSLKTEEYVKDGRKYKRDVTCKTHSADSEEWRECFVQNYMELNTGEWILTSTAYEYPDDGNTPQHDSFLHAGEFLKNGAWITSEDGTHFAIMLADGNLAIYEGTNPERVRKEQAIWETSTHTFSSSYCRIEIDGNLAIYTGESPASMESVLWHTNRRGVIHAGARFYGKLENDGNLVVWGEVDGRYERQKECLWASIGCPDSRLFESPVSAILLMRNQWRLKSHRRAFEQRSWRWQGSSSSVGIPQWIKEGFHSIWEWVAGGRNSKPGSVG